MLLHFIHYVITIAYYGSDIIGMVASLNIINFSYFKTLCIGGERKKKKLCV